MSDTHNTGLRSRMGADTEEKAAIDEGEIHDILRNWRRRMTIKELKSSAGPMTLRELAETLAEAETGESPPPRNVRNSVYNSLHQNHLPKLNEAGIIQYDSDRKTILLEPRARDVGLYTEVVTQYGITWATYYRRLLSLALLAFLGSEIGVPILADIPGVLLIGVFFAAVVVSTVAQCWSDRWHFLRPLLD